MKSKDLSELTGLSVSKLYFYEKEGLISPSRKASGYRDYSDEEVEKIKFIVFLKSLNFQLSEIRQIIAEYDELLLSGDDMKCANALTFFSQKRAEFMEKIARYQLAVSLIDELFSEHDKRNKPELSQEIYQLTDDFWQKRQA